MFPASKLNGFYVLCMVVYFVTGNEKPSQEGKKKRGKEVFFLVFGCFLLKEIY